MFLRLTYSPLSPPNVSYHVRYRCPHCSVHLLIIGESLRSLLRSSLSCCCCCYVCIEIRCKSHLHDYEVSWLLLAAVGRDGCWNPPRGVWSSFVVRRGGVEKRARGTREKRFGIINCGIVTSFHEREGTPAAKNNAKIPEVSRRYFPRCIPRKTTNKSLVLNAPTWYRNRDVTAE